ncbi:hypothetical protein QEH52_11885 [Coraliomargarita sp. SDUM461003]|uniref:Uncharacterized protein n=1 Tax=Thalassobacterium maritimum TaxID=3041265 RepID=A0ABU1AVN6_9BACT|nr:hypothetical protein [Coraliomargarita sp. SDUM461003]MDQ8208213.1 hypothetical protein [Coraliomargarita sp. SDUM461003]
MILSRLKSFKASRDGRIALSVLTAFGSKFGGAALQLFALPLVVRSLGVQDFAIFALSSSILAFFMFSNLGIGGYLVVLLPSARKSSGREVSAILSNALVTTISVGLVFIFLLYGYCRIYGLSEVFGGVYDYAPELVVDVLCLVLFFGLLQLMISIFISAQNAYQELYYNNVYGGLGSFASAVSILIYYNVNPSGNVIAYLLAFYLPSLFFQILSSIHFVIRHPETCPRFDGMRPSLVRSMIFGGGAFVIAQTVLPLVIREVPKLTFASEGALVDVTTYSLLMVLLSILGGITLSLTQPMFGSLSDAWTSGDFLWAIRRVVQITLLFVGMGVVLALIGKIYGEALTTAWVGAEAAISNHIMFLFGCYFSINCIFHIFTLSLFVMKLKTACVLVNLSTAVVFCLLLPFAVSRGVDGVLVVGLLSVGGVGVPLSLLYFYKSLKGFLVDEAALTSLDLN